jgi:hypothetical protein
MSPSHEKFGLTFPPWICRNDVPEAVDPIESGTNPGQIPEVVLGDRPDVFARLGMHKRPFLTVGLAVTH